MKITAVTCIKNEGPFLLEWIAYNRLIGVTDFLIYSNDCADGSDRLLDALAERGIVHHLPNPAKGRSLQMEALRAARRHPAAKEADWIWTSDVDEFLNIHAGDHTILSLVEACGTPEAISVSFQFFANCGIERFEDRPVIEQFTHSHNPDLWGGDSSMEVKTLYSGRFPLRDTGPHRPLVLTSRDRPLWTDGSGRPVPVRFAYAAAAHRLRRFPVRGARRHATLNHYALRSLDSFLIKADRGDVNRDDRQFDLAYWRDRNDPAWEDRSIQRCLPELRTVLSEWTDDPVLGSLHREAVRWHMERRDRLLLERSWRDLADQLRTAPATPPAEATLLERLGLGE